MSITVKNNFLLKNKLYQQIIIIMLSKLIVQITLNAVVCCLQILVSVTAGISKTVVGGHCATVLAFAPKKDHQMYDENAEQLILNLCKEKKFKFFCHQS